MCNCTARSHTHNWAQCSSSAGYFFGIEIGGIGVHAPHVPTNIIAYCRHSAADERNNNNNKKKKTKEKESIHSHKAATLIKCME